jgi:hypothetical protein
MCFRHFVCRILVDIITYIIESSNFTVLDKYLTVTFVSL